MLEWVVLWALSLFAVAALVFMAVYVLVSLSDLQGDAINPIDMCQSLNNLVLPEIGIHGALTIVFLLTGHWFEVLLNLPLVAWNAWNIKERKYRYDATQIFRVVENVRRVNFAKLGFYMLFFFFLLYRLISSIIYAVTDDDSPTPGSRRGRRSAAASY